MVLFERAASVSVHNVGPGDSFCWLAEDFPSPRDFICSRIVSPTLAYCLDFLLQPDEIQKKLLRVEVGPYLV